MLSARHKKKHMVSDQAEEHHCTNNIDLGKVVLEIRSMRMGMGFHIIIFSRVAQQPGMPYHRTTPVI